MAVRASRPTSVQESVNSGWGATPGDLGNQRLKVIVHVVSALW